MSRNLYVARTGVEPTTVSFVKLATGVAIHTLMQVATPSDKQIIVVEWGISFDGFVALLPVNVELMDTSVAASTGTSLTPSKYGDPNAPASLCIGGAALTMFSDGTVTENTVANSRMLDHRLLPPTQPFSWQFPLGREPMVDVSRFLRMRVLAGTGVNVSGYIIWEE